ncbi:MAG: GNAT family N-acetyltransferase, partial [Actinobacteria bacterium]|nr:GNAT family N-acetyltransferase [Actinomycetota bacterium]
MPYTMPYPAHWEANVVLVDGGTVFMRPITPEDADRLVDLHQRLSAETIHYRFFSPRPRLSARDVERFTVVDHDDRVALVAMLGDDMIAVARYDRLPGTDEAEVAFVVEDSHQGRGLGTLLLEHLAAAARERGISRFVAETLPDNQPMIGVFRSAGWAVRTRFEDGLVVVEFPIETTPEALVAQEGREHRAEARSVARLLRPSSIAVIGASRTPGSVGHEVFRNLLQGGFNGPVYPVHPTASHVASVRAYASVMDIPDDVDLAVVVVPAGVAPDVVLDCARKRVRGLVIISGGFAETGEKGAEAERELVALAHRHGMRVVGPNSMGIINTDATVSMNATIDGHRPLPGGVGFLSQSGALGVAILESMASLGLGVSSFVSVGNKADVSGNDLLQYWEGDERTDVVLLYLESFGNPRKFTRLARRVSRVKPIVVVKTGRRHRDAGIMRDGRATDDGVLDALFRQTGVLRVDTLQQLFDVASVLTSQPLPDGHRVAVVASAGGAALLAVDACEGVGLQVPPLSSGTTARLTTGLPEGTRVGNPIEMPAAATPSDYGRALDLVLGANDVDAALVIHAAAGGGPTGEVAAEVARAGRRAGKPVVANFLASPADRELDELGTRSGVPTFASPESAALALARAGDYGHRRRRPRGDVVLPEDIDREAALRGVEIALASTAETDDDEDVVALLDCYGIKVDPLGARSEHERAVDLAIEVSQDPFFGPLMSLSTAGPAAELINDRVYRALPLTDLDAGEMIHSLRSWPYLNGERGRERGDLAALEMLLARVSCLGDDLQELSTLVLDPVVLRPGGVSVAHARAVLSSSPPWPRNDPNLRR